MRPLIPFVLLAALLIAPPTRAEDAADFRDKGIAALKESQSNPRAIVDAARHFVKAADLYTAAGNDEKTVEMNSFLYWCKKKMTMQDIDAFVQGGESAVSNKLTAVEKLAPAVDDAQKFFDRAEQFAQQNPAEHLLIAIRFYEVADRFKGSDAALQAMDRSLKEQLLDKSSAAKTTVPPVAVAAPKLAPATSGSQPIPPPEKLKEAEKTIKELFKAEYAQTDSPSRLALVAKLLQQADENKNDTAAEYVLLRDARDFAVIAGDAAQAATAHKRLCDSFKLDFAAILADLHRLEPTAKSAEAATALAKLARSSADDALEADNFDQAVRFNSLVDDLLPLLKDAALKARLKGEIAYAQALKRDSVPALAAVKTLSTKPDDPDANLAAGKFALERGRFEHAFAKLAKGKDTVLAAVAKRELTPPTEATEQVQIADGWFDLVAKEQSNYLKVRIQERAALWYGNALPALTGLTKVKVEGRLKNLEPTRTPNAVVAVKSAPMSKHWISKDATYTVSSTYMHFAPKPSLLNGEKPAYSTDPGDGFSFATNDEVNAYALIDLGTNYRIESFEIANRGLARMQERAKTLTMWVSNQESGPWAEVWRAAGAEPKWESTLIPAIEGRYAKIGLRDKVGLQLASIKLFGEPVKSAGERAVPRAVAGGASDLIKLIPGIWKKADTGTEFNFEANQTVSAPRAQKEVYRSGKWVIRNGQVVLLFKGLDEFPLNLIDNNTLNGSWADGNWTFIRANSVKSLAAKELVLDLNGGIKLELVLITAGAFQMGGSGADATPNEKPAHSVRITKDFYIGKYEVTQEQYESVIGKNPSHFKSPRNPVEDVKWSDAELFCQKLNDKVNASLPAGTKIQLPTEAQWEYACRAGTTTRFYLGNKDGDLEKAGWIVLNSEKKTHPVGEKEPNKWGLYDMHGNVKEWCADAISPYQANAQSDPKGTEAGNGRVLRGGGWSSGPKDSSSAFRSEGSPDTRSASIGFRIAVSAIPNTP